MVLILLDIPANGGLLKDVLVDEVCSFDRNRKSEELEAPWTRKRVKSQLASMLGEPHPVVFVHPASGNISTSVAPRSPESAALGVGVLEDSAAAYCALTRPTLVSTVQKCIRAQSHHQRYRGQIRNYEIHLQVAVLQCLQYIITTWPDLQDSGLSQCTPASCAGTEQRLVQAPGGPLPGPPLGEGPPQSRACRGGGPLPQDQGILRTPHGPLRGGGVPPGKEPTLASFPPNPLFHLS